MKAPQQSWSIRAADLPGMSSAALRASRNRVQHLAEDIARFVGWPELVASLLGSVAEMDAELSRRGITMDAPAVRPAYPNKPKSQERQKIEAEAFEARHLYEMAMQ